MIDPRHLRCRGFFVILSLKIIKLYSFLKHKRTSLKFESQNFN